jgi:chromosome segregation ATPase
MRLLLQAGFLCLFATVVAAQTRAPIPTLTTEDVVGTKPSVPAPPLLAKDPAKDAGKDVRKNPVQPEPAKTLNAADEAKKKAEKEWNERLKKAQEKQSDLERRGDQTELEITQLRNQLFSAAARAPEANGQLNARSSELSAQRQRLRAEAQAAGQEVSKLEAEGQSNFYQRAAVSLTNEKGEPDATAYQAEQARLRTEMQDAQARIEVLQIRLNNIQGEVLKKGNGDNFTLNRLRQEREQMTTELRETRARIEDLNNNLQAHRQKAAAAGIPLSAQ